MERQSEDSSLQGFEQGTLHSAGLGIEVRMGSVSFTHNPLY